MRPRVPPVIYGPLGHCSRERREGGKEGGRAYLLADKLEDAARGADDDVGFLVTAQELDVLLDGHAAVEHGHADLGREGGREGGRKEGCSY